MFPHQLSPHITNLTPAILFQMCFIYLHDKHICPSVLWLILILKILQAFVSLDVFDQYLHQIRGGELLLIHLKHGVEKLLENSKATHLELPQCIVCLAQLSFECIGSHNLYLLVSRVPLASFSDAEHARFIVAKSSISKFLHQHSSHKQI